MPASKANPKASKPPESAKPTKATVHPIRVDGRNRRTDDDALEGSFVTIVAGEHEGRLASFEQVQSYGKDGYPTEVVVRTRDADSLLLSVPYADIRPAATNGGR